jgi:CubicO group peptidase (beta-lactamase class C family)/Flp pilus assembly protein TadD
MRRLALAAAAALLLHLCAAVPAGAASTPQRRATSAALDPGKLRAFERFVAATMKLDHTPGLTVGFVRGDATWVGAYGYADLENGTPAKPESAYRLASVTKPMTAVAVLQLVERGKIDLDAEVQTYVPYFPKKPWPVTVRQLLGHVGGISHYMNAERELHIKTHMNTRQAIGIFESFDLVAEPGTKYSYSSYGYNLLGAVIEGASGKPFGEYMRENVWGPLGMKDTRMDDPTEVIPNRVRGYQFVDGKVRNSEFVDISSRFAAGGTRSTVPDMLAFAKGLMAGKLLSPASRDLMYTSLATKDGMRTDYSLGWSTDPLGGRFSVSHSGGQNETRTLLFVFPSRNLALAAAINFESASPGPYLARLFEVVTGERWEIDPYTTDPVATAILRGMNDAFGHGLAYYERYGKELGDPAGRAEAFAYFNRAVDRSAIATDAGRTALAAGRHPAAGDAFVKVGSAMAAALESKLGAARVREYPALGAITFFNDYMKLYEKDSTLARFDAPFEQSIAKWQASWARTNDAYVRGLSAGPDLDLNVAGPRLRALFANAEVYPNLSGSLLETADGYAASGDRARAVETARFAADLYPRSDQAAARYGVILVAFGERERGVEQLRRSLAMNPTGGASAARLNGAAYAVASVGMLDSALEVLKVAVEFHPKEANLYDTIGEFYLRAGKRDLSIQWYRKALEVDPNLKTAIEALKRIESGQ